MGKRINLAALAEEDLVEETDTITPEVIPPRAAAAAAAEPVAATVVEPGRSRTVATSSVAVNPLNKRPKGEDDEIAALADTVIGQGVIQPLVVCSVDAFLAEFPDQADTFGPEIEWVALIGNRRLLAVRRAGLDEIDIIVTNDQVASMYEVMLIENGQRRALPPLHEAEAMDEVLKKENISRRELGRRIGKTHTYINQRLALLNLIPPLRAALEHGELKIELARQFGDLEHARQHEIVAAGRPYRVPTPGNAVSNHARRRNIRAATPAIAAQSIRERFTPDELAELIRLLTEAAAVDEPDAAAAAN